MNLTDGIGNWNLLGSSYPIFIKWGSNLGDLLDQQSAKITVLQLLAQRRGPRIGHLGKKRCGGVGHTYIRK
jgi:hypothetical protein